MRDPIVPAMTENVPKDITMTSETEETVLDLLPCPFCGCARIYERGFRCFECLECRAEGPTKATKAEAVAAWNTRAALTRAPEASREGAAERLAIVAEKPAHLIRWGEGDRLDLQSVLAALPPPSTGGEGEADQVGAAEAEVGRHVYRRIERLMDAKPGTVEGAELCYLAEIAEGVEEYGEQACDGNPLGRFPHPSPEMGEISREEIAREIDAEAFSKNPWDATEALAMSKRRVAALDKADAKLKENGLSREELGGLARSQPGSDAQERSPVPPISDGGRV